MKCLHITSGFIKTGCMLAYTFVELWKFIARPNLCESLPTRHGTPSRPIVKQCSMY
ncbi:MAG: hypothetical protein FWD66_03295 [Paludibacter sp.]|nr:hypothetical protein [Paludibacter sp.]